MLDGYCNYFANQFNFAMSAVQHIIIAPTWLEKSHPLKLLLSVSVFIDQSVFGLYDMVVLHAIQNLGDLSCKVAYQQNSMYCSFSQHCRSDKSCTRKMAV